LTTSSASLHLPPRRGAALPSLPAWLAASLAMALAVLIACAPSVSGTAPPPSARAAHSRRASLSLPAAARGPVSAALGAGLRAYRVLSARGGLTAANPAQRLGASFDAAGVTLRSGSTSVGLRLLGVGSGRSLVALAAAAPSARANRVIYEHPDVREWYANGPLGLEQGFTITRAPTGAGDGPLTLAIALTGNARAALAADGRSLTLGHAGGPELGYGGLVASDANGRALRSWLVLHGGRLLVRVDARDARYPVSIDPFVHQGEKLTAAGLSGPYGYVGMSVALSADGNTALVGAPADAEYTGAAFVFTRSGSIWTQQGGKLTGSGTVGEAWFGESVALSADGNTAVIGGPSDNGAVGGAWVFTRSGSSWTQQGGKLTGAGESGAGYFGRSVALSADGNTALIGGYNDDEHRGAAWVFTRSGSTWSQQGEKLLGGGNPGFFGWSVALSAQASTALIGEWGLEGGVGAAWVFTRSGSTWTRQSEPLTAGAGSPFSWFGYSLALSAAGSTALVGAPHGGGYAGQAWVFTRAGSTWTRQGEPLAGGEEVGEGELGYSAALSADGNVALLGGRVDNGFHGAAWAFQRAGAKWTQEGEKLTGSGEASNREEFGWSVALSSGADTALVGSPCDSACVGSVSAFLDTTPTSPPEYGRCEKVAKGSGAFASAACTTTGGLRDYEWSQGALASPFTIKLASGAASLETIKGARVTCAGETGTGAYSGRKQVGQVVLTLTGCEHAGERCASTGAAAGEIVSNALEGVLGVEKLGVTAVKNKIGLDLFPPGGTGAVMEFDCGATHVSVRGSVIAAVASNRMLSSSSLKFAAAKGRQKPESFVGEQKDVLEASFASGTYEQAGLTLAATQAGEEPLETNSTI